MSDATANVFQTKLDHMRATYRALYAEYIEKYKLHNFLEGAATIKPEMRPMVDGVPTKASALFRDDLMRLAFGELDHRDGTLIRFADGTTDLAKITRNELAVLSDAHLLNIRVLARLAGELNHEDLGIRRSNLVAYVLGELDTLCDQRNVRAGSQSYADFRVALQKSEQDRGVAPQLVTEWERFFAQQHPQTMQSKKVIQSTGLQPINRVVDDHKSLGGLADRLIGFHADVVKSARVIAASSIPWSAKVQKALQLFHTYVSTHQLHTSEPETVRNSFVFAVNTGGVRISHNHLADHLV